MTVHLISQLFLPLLTEIDYRITLILEFNSLFLVNLVSKFYIEFPVYLK